MPHSIDLSGKTTVVTGACGILGSAFTQILSAAGSRVVALDLPAAVESAQGSTQIPDNVHYFPVDLADPNSIKSVSETILSRFGAPYGLINNAASKGTDTAAFMKDALDISLETWHEVASVNLDGSFFLTQALGRSMVQAKRGSIIFIGSIYGEVAPDPRVYEGSNYQGGPINTPPVYSATKAALSGLTRYLAAYWGTHGVRVNCVCPGGVSSGQNSIFTERYSDRVPLRRMATPADIAVPTLFLLSEGAGYITGQTLLIDGGLSIW